MALKIFSRFSSPVLLSATVFASEGNKDEQEKKNLVRARDLSIYSNAPQKSDDEKGKETESESTLLTIVREVRQSIWTVSDQLGQMTNKMNDVVETGKAHMSSSIQILRDDENYIQRYGAIAAGGVVGYVMALRRGWIRRIVYSTSGATAVAAICYPEEAKEYSSEGFQQAKRYIVVAYHFVNGEPQKKQGTNSKKTSSSSTKNTTKNPQNSKIEPEPTSFPLQEHGPFGVDPTNDHQLYSRRS